MPRLRSSLLVIAVLVLGACGSPPDGSSGSGRSHTAQPGSGEPSGGASQGHLTVFAAASLTETFTAIATAFEEAHTGTTITLNLASSSSLASQIREGAPADVFASADSASMAKLAESTELATAPTVFAANRLQIIVEAGNPRGIHTIADLARQDLIVVAAGADVPIGRYAAQILDNARVEVRPRSYESNVKAIVTKVVLGEADAGIVYATDVVAAGMGATGVAIPDDINVVAQYPIAVTAATGDVALARSFIDFVLGPAGQQILRDAGFAAP